MGDRREGRIPARYFWTSGRRGLTDVLASELQVEQYGEIDNYSNAYSILNVP